MWASWCPMRHEGRGGLPQKRNPNFLETPRRLVTYLERSRRLVTLASAELLWRLVTLRLRGANQQGVTNVARPYVVSMEINGNLFYLRYKEVHFSVSNKVTQKNVKHNSGQSIRFRICQTPFSAHYFQLHR